MPEYCTKIFSQTTRTFAQKKCRVYFVIFFSNLHNHWNCLPSISTLAIIGQNENFHADNLTFFFYTASRRALSFVNKSLTLIIVTVVCEILFLSPLPEATRVSGCLCIPFSVLELNLSQVLFTPHLSQDKSRT